MTLAGIIQRLRSPHADKVFVAKDYTKADLIADLETCPEASGYSMVGLFDECEDDSRSSPAPR